MGDIKTRFDDMTVADALALNEAARRTCEFEMTSEIGEKATYIREPNGEAVA